MKLLISIQACSSWEVYTSIYDIKNDENVTVSQKKLATENENIKLIDIRIIADQNTRKKFNILY